jgi:hypothetical protein
LGIFEGSTPAYAPPFSKFNSMATGIVKAKFADLISVKGDVNTLLK